MSSVGKIRIFINLDFGGGGLIASIATSGTYM